jgi:hypothetical protein
MIFGWPCMVFAPVILDHDSNRRILVHAARAVMVHFCELFATIFTLSPSIRINKAFNFNKIYFNASKVAAM